MGYLKKHLQSVILLTIGVAAFIRGVLFLDPDFGWHLKMGELILQKGIPLTDPFSYTMSSYPFIDHEWLSNILISIGYKTIGIYGLALMFALIFVWALYLAIPQKIKNYSLLPLTLAGGLIFSFAGIRTQVVTWFFLGLLLKVIFDENLWKKWKFFLPLLFPLWVNLHGGFAIGIALLFLLFIFKSLQNKRFELVYFIIALFSVFLTFVNPYGPRIWWEIWQQISDNSLKWSVSEWAPGIFYTNFSFLALFALSFSFIFKYKAKIGGLQSFIYLFLLLLAISGIRHIPLWALSAVFVVSAGIKLLIDEVRKNQYAKNRLKKMTRILFLIMFFMLLFEVTTSLFGAYNLSEQKYYPAKAVRYLKTQNIKDENIFTVYDYGGYLIWKLSGKKVFIDGRMPSWRRQGNYQNESNYAFQDYLKMLSDDNYFKQMLKKYNIHYVLLPVYSSNNKVPAFVAKLRNLAQKLTLFKTNTKVISGDLTKMGMKRVYNDGQFTIYKI